MDGIMEEKTSKPHYCSVIDGHKYLCQGCAAKLAAERDELMRALRYQVGREIGREVGDIDEYIKQLLKLRKET